MQNPKSEIRSPKSGIARFAVPLFVAIWLTNPVFSQVFTEKCGTRAVLDHYRSLDPMVEKRLADLETFTQNWEAKVANSVRNRTVVTIPVVVHVVWRFPSENISDDQILSQITVLNQDFRKLNVNLNSAPPEFLPLAADCELEFCLAKIDPAGQPTNGITRTQTNQSFIGSLTSASGEFVIKHTTLGGHDAWDESKYLNIWIGSLSAGLFGYATFPDSAPAGEDGVVVGPKYFGTIGLAAGSTPQQLGRTTTHEIGHYFNLHHIWGDGNNSCNDDDGVADTPVQKNEFYGCPSHPQMSCGNKALFIDFMDYTDDACMRMFTEGQKTRMHAALNGPRASLVSSNACLISPTQTPENPHLPGGQESFVIFPNPAETELFIRADVSKLEICRVFNSFGQPIFCPKTTLADGLKLDVSHLPDGPYFLQVNGRSQLFLKKTAR